MAAVGTSKFVPDSLTDQIRENYAMSGLANFPDSDSPVHLSVLESWEGIRQFFSLEQRRQAIQKLQPLLLQCKPTDFRDERVKKLVQTNCALINGEPTSLSDLERRDAFLTNSFMHKLH